MMTNKNTLREFDDVIDQLLALKIKLEDQFPKILLLINGCKNFDLLRETLLQVSPKLIDLFQEITIFDHYPVDVAQESLKNIKGIPVFRKLCFYRTPIPYNYGDNLKNGFDYAVEKGFDFVMVLKADGLYDPAKIPLFLITALNQNCPVVFGCRFSGTGSEAFSSMAFLKRLANRFLSGIEEAVLRMGLKDYHCGYRLYSTKVLRRIPYRLNTSNYLFDLQMLIQIRNLGVEIRIVSVPPFYDSAMGPSTMVLYAIKALATGIGYRLHQLHVFRKGIYLVNLDETYALKKNRYSSHMQIIEAIEPGSSVLDLGCGRGVLSQEYAKKGISVVGVDNISPDKVSPQLQNYIQQDLESELNLPYGRVFDYIVLSDVIEHIKNREVVMKSLRRYLKATGQAVVSTGNIAIWFYRLSLLLGRFEYGPKGILDRTHVHLFTLDSFSRFVQESGYRILNIRYTPIPFELVLSSTGRNAFVERITHWYHTLTLLWPQMFAYQFIIKCTFSSYESAKDEEMWESS